MNQTNAANMSNTEMWQNMDGAHHLHPFTNPNDLLQKPPRIIESAQGVYLTDSEGNELLDMMAGLWCVNMGYGQQDIIDAATAQINQLPYYNAFFKTSTPPAAELSALLAEITPAHMHHAFFTSSGSEANDTVLRLVWRYWDLLGKPEKRVVISRKNAYHGSTIAASSLGGMADMHAQGGVIPDIVHVDEPNWFARRCELGADLDREEFGRQVAQSIADKIEELGVDKVAAFIAEPIQGAGGVIIPPDTYLPEIQRICRERNILLVADEVICGFGRTGNMWGSETFRIEPDLMSIAKGMTSGYVPMGGVFISDRVAGPLMEKAGEIYHGYTYSGHPAACAAGMASLRIMQEEKLVERVRDDTGPYLQSRWATLGDHPLVGEARMVGLIGALELVRDKKTMERFPTEVSAGGRCRDISVGTHGLVMRATGDVMVLSPPLVISRDECDELVARARKSLDDLADELTRDGAL